MAKLTTAKQTTQTIVNRYIRERDKYICFTCGKKEKPGTAGHFVTVGAGNSVRYEEKNIHHQCIRCNKWLSGNVIEYYPKMVELYGQEYVDDLRLRSKQPRKYTLEELKDIRVEYKNKYNELIKQNE